MGFWFVYHLMIGIYIGFKGCGYGVATVSRIDKIKGLFCRMSSLLYGSFEKATYN